MKKVIALSIVLAALASYPALACDAAKAASQTVAQEAGKEVTLTGWISDQCCAAKNAHKEGAGCVKACAKHGAKLVLYTGEKSYVLSDQKAALEHAGRHVQVTGTVTRDGSLEVTKIVPTEKDNV